MTQPVADAVARFTARWRESLRTGAEPPRPADFVPRAAHARRAVLLALVRADIRARAAHPGLVKDIDDYRAEFPELSDTSALIDLLAVATRSAADLTRTGAARPDHTSAASTDGRTAPATPLDDIEGTETACAARPGRTHTASRTPIPAATDGTARPGDRIDDFDLLAELGEGASGRVFLARQISMQRLVTLRLTRGTELPHAMAELDHPHIVRVYDQRLPGGAEGLVYMQYLPGGTAEHLLAARRSHGPTGGGLLLRAVDTAMETKGEIPPSDSPIRARLAGLGWPETVAWIGRGLATALDYAARHGTLHRAVKPANVVFTAEGVPKLADFAADPTGIDTGAALRYRAPEELAALGRGPRNDPQPSTGAVGEPGHAAPEVGARADIYALGLLLWELLTGRCPFDDEGLPPEQMLAHRRRGLPDSATAALPAGCPTALVRVLRTCLDPDPARRWPDGAVLAQQLDLCLDERARELVDPPPGSPRRRLVRWRVPLIAAAITVPNVLASLYNIDHSRKLITGRLTERTQELFATSTVVTNLLFFAMAAALLTYWSRRIITVPRGLRAGVTYPPGELARARRDAILLGDRAVLVAFGFWMISAASYPLGVTAAGDRLAPHAFAHFLASHAVCGAIALAYPFFLVNFYVVRCLYPMLLGHSAVGTDDGALLRGLQRRCVGYLLIAASIPLLAVAGVTLLPVEDVARIIVVVRVLCLGSIVMFVASYLLFRAIERDLSALARVARPGLAPLTTRA
ncbi:protein kinase domain-containing protein [Nocardia farcinica]|uniref:protein kinase domain-containing protein n=1 Tax=Nocardia farcinica TaxID=37329 RepID=UPI0018943DAF|nr:protein kinase [Nocardia farcinica]MBF6234291.1 serine/threonine protein kinase [Nocardia farcinica]